jgi:hypothetical protein
MYASRASAGRRAGNGRPVAIIPAGVRQHRAGPGPTVPVAAYPAARYRAVITRNRAGRGSSAAASRSYGAA